MATTRTGAIVTASAAAVYVDRTRTCPVSDGAASGKPKRVCVEAPSAACVYERKCDVCEKAITDSKRAFVLVFRDVLRWNSIPMVHVGCCKDIDPLYTFTIQVAECTATDCRSEHRFAVHHHNSYEHAVSGDCHYQWSRRLLVCEKILCRCCGSQNNGDGSFVDNLFFCHTCLVHCYTHLDLACACRPDTCIESKYSTVCPRHIGLGWKRPGQPQVGWCAHCHQWVNLHGFEPDGQVVELTNADGKLRKEMMHSYCLEYYPPKNLVVPTQK